MFPRRLTSFLLPLVCPLLLAVAARSATIRVHCGVHPPSINGALRLLDPAGPNTIRVSGTCHENVVIQGFDRLTLEAVPGGATIDDASKGNNPAVTIVDSQRVIVQGFTINGGSPGILCGDFSLCRFSQNVVQGAVDNGVIVSRSRASFAGDTIQNTGFRGLVLREQSTVVIDGVTLQGNPNAGADVHDASFLYSLQSTVQNNGFGIRSEQSTLRIELSTVSISDRGGSMKTKPDDEREGFGLRNTRARLKQLYSSRQDLRLENDSGGGWRVILSIPISGTGMAPQQLAKPGSSLSSDHHECS